MRSLLLPLLLATALPASAAPPVHDLLIVNGTVVDGTGAPPRRADLLIDGDTIVRVGVLPRTLRVKRTIDAKGLTVTPGFIDNHAHGDALGPLSFENFLLQGETTVVLGQDGESPQDEDHYGERVSLADWRAAAGQPGGAKPVTLAQWFTAVDRKGIEVNVAALSGHGTDRVLAGVGNAAEPTAVQSAAMAEIVRADMAAGAFGLSSGLEYVPGIYSRTPELVALADVVGREGGVVMSHLRSEDDDRIAGAIDELLAQGRTARVNVSHIKIVYGQNAGQARAVLAQLAAARARGIRVSADVYPYIAGHADLSLVYPPWAKSREDWNAAVRDRRAELEAYLVHHVNKRNGPEAILFTKGQYAGRTLKQVADTLGLPFQKVIIDVFGFPGPDAAHRVMTAAVQDVFVTAPDVSISTDGAPWMAHPRSWGTFAKVFEEYVVKTRRMTVELAVRKMTGLPAAELGLTDRGTLAVGKKADIVVLDLPNVHATATWEKPAQAPTGYRAVIVNGHVAAENGVRAAGLFGRALRRPHTGAVR